MKAIIQYWKKEKWWLSFLITFTFISTVIALIFPYILKDIIDGIKVNFARKDLFSYILILGSLGFLRAFFNAVLPFCRGRTNEMFLIQERTNIFAKILHKGYSFANCFGVGNVLQRLDHDLNEYSWFACSGVFRPIEGIFIILVALFFLIKINLWLTIVAVAPMTLAIFVWMRISPLLYKYYYAWRRTISDTNDYLQASFSGIKLVKSYTMEGENHRQFDELLHTRIKAAIKVIKNEALVDTLFTSIEEIGIIFVLLVGGIFIIRGGLTIGEFIAFNAYIILLLGPMIRIGHFFVTKRRADVQGERLEEITEYSVDVKDEGRISAFQGSNILMKNVTFAYDKDSAPVLRDINTTISFGKKVGIAGTVGSGKSTLLKLLLRIVEPTIGEIRIGDCNLRDMPLSTSRSLFGYVPQEPLLFSDSIYNNITFGRECDVQRLDEIIKLAQLEDFVKDQPKGMDELIGERGLKLSGGEKQRIAIARALLDRPQILILDDATSNLDAETEKEFINQLSDTMDSTVVIVSHRLSILSNCDYIYVLDKGEIVEQGTHDELLKQRGLYWKLYQYQLAEEELEKV